MVNLINGVDGSVRGYLPTVKVIGVGGGGCNAVNRMHTEGVTGAEFIAINTDLQSLEGNEATIKLDIGVSLTGGNGAGSDPSIGRLSAEESASDIEELLKDARMVIICTGEGGGTGTGASPVIARIAKDLGILTIAIATKPYSFEGAGRAKLADEGIEALRSEVDSLMVIPNDNLARFGDKQFKIADAFAYVDEVLHITIKAITSITQEIGFLNVDMKDIENAIKNSGNLIVGLAEASGPDRVAKAVEAAISSPLLESKIDGSSSAIFCLYGSPDSITNEELNEGGQIIQNLISPDAFFKAGLFFDESYGETVKAIIIAGGSDNSMLNSAKPLTQNVMPTFEANQPTKTQEQIKISPQDSKVNIPSFGDTNQQISNNFDEAQTLVNAPINPNFTEIKPITSPTEVIQNPTSKQVFDSSANNPVVPMGDENLQYDDNFANTGTLGEVSLDDLNDQNLNKNKNDNSDSNTDSGINIELPNFL